MIMGMNCVHFTVTQCMNVLYALSMGLLSQERERKNWGRHQAAPELCYQWQ